MNTLIAVAATDLARLVRILVMRGAFLAAAWGVFLGIVDARADEPADLILHGGKIVTVDKSFSIVEALALRGGAIVRVGSNANVLALRGEKTEVVDLAGRMALPGLIDSHTHPSSACMTEFDHPLPDMESIDDVLKYVASRAAVLGPDKWIEMSQIFITRLREQRYPTRAELDAAAPHNPVVFATGPDASLNSLALKLSGINRDFRVVGSGFVEKDPLTGEPTGILRGCTRYVKSEGAGKRATNDDRRRRLLELFRDYNSVGITTIADRDADSSAVERYAELRRENALPVRIAVSRHLGTDGALDEIKDRIRAIAADPLVRKDAELWIVGVKAYLDGGMLTGSAYMREPWGMSQIYSIRDPQYRGVLMIPPERLLPIVRATVEAGMQFTAHSVGDGAVHALLDAYEEVNRATSVRKTRPCLTHSNFMSADAVRRLAGLGVVADIQPAWLYLDSHTLAAQFGYDRLRYFQPLASIFAAGGIAGGGSDHMQKIGSLRATNPYNPFLGMGTAVTRRAKKYERPLHPEEALTREQAIRIYTINNAFLLFQEDKLGSLEVGKRGDVVVVDTDLLTCPADAIKSTKVLRTYRDGRLLYRQPDKAKP